MDKQPEFSSANDYLARLGLQEDPFSTSADSSFYYENPDLMQRLDMIQHLIGFSNQMIFVTGKHGIGKTSMLNRLEYYAPDHWRVCNIEGQPMLNTPTLLRQLTSGFGVDISADADDLFQVYSDALQDHITNLERAMLTPVVLIDNAHELPIDAFILLFGFMQQDSGQARLKMALFCEPQITNMLESPQLKALTQNITHHLEIPAFTEAQTREYLEQRLQNAGLNGDFPFLADTVRRIHRDAEGIAGKINTLAQQSLLDEDSQSLPIVDEILEFDSESASLSPRQDSAKNSGEAAPIGRKFQSWQIGAVAAVMALLAGVLWLTSQVGDDQEPSIAENIPLNISTGIDEEKETVNTGIKYQDQDPGLFEESTTSGIDSTPIDLAALDRGTVKPEDPSTDDQGIKTDDTDTSKPVPGNSDPLDEFVKEIEQQHQQLSNEQPLQLNEAGVEIGIDDQASIVEEKKPEIAPVEAVKVTPVKTAAVDERKVTDRASSSDNQFSIPGIKDGQWLSAQDDQQIVLQLLGTHDQNALRKFFAENQLGDDIAWFTTTHEGKPWYVVVRGPFKDRPSATAAIASLPADVKKRNPWPRSIDSVKKSMAIAP